MRKVASFCRWSLLMGVACGLAVLPIGSSAAHAEAISMTIMLGNGDTIPVDPLILSGASPTNYGTVDLTTLNGVLAADGSAYSFSALGGSSNWSGAASGGSLTLSGGISLSTPGGVTGLTITETESGFITPSGPSGTLASSSTGNFNGAGPGNSHSASSQFNALPPIPAYTVASTISGPDHEGAGASAPITSFSTPYTLTNTISFALSTNGATDSFGVTSSATAIPEPASVVMMLIGLPLPLVGLAWLRRRRTVLQNS